MSMFFLTRFHLPVWVNPCKKNISIVNNWKCKANHYNELKSGNVTVCVTAYVNFARAGFASSFAQLESTINTRIGLLFSGIPSTQRCYICVLLLRTYDEAHWLSVSMTSMKSFAENVVYNLFLKLPDLADC